MGPNPFLPNSTVELQNVFAPPQRGGMEIHMKDAIIGSRSLNFENFDDYIPAECTEIVTGGAKGIDACARSWAEARNIPVTEFLPDYTRYKRGAPLIRNQQIGNYADMVIAFWVKFPWVTKNKFTIFSG